MKLKILHNIYSIIKLGNKRTVDHVCVLGFILIALIPSALRAAGTALCGDQFSQKAKN